jgi:hypothetical protein
VELYLHSPNTASWCGAQSKHRDDFTFVFFPNTVIRLEQVGTRFYSVFQNLFPCLFPVIPRIPKQSHVSGIDPDQNLPRVSKLRSLCVSKRKGYPFLWILIFCVTMPCNVASINQHFGVACCLHLLAAEGTRLLQNVG